MFTIIIRCVLWNSQTPTLKVKVTHRDQRSILCNGWRVYFNYIYVDTYYSYSVLGYIPFYFYEDLIAACADLAFIKILHWNNNVCFMYKFPTAGDIGNSVNKSFLTVLNEISLATL